MNFLRKGILKYVSQHQHHGYVSWWARFCWDVWRMYENHNYNPRANGEYRLLERLSAFNPQRVLDVGANVSEWSIRAAGVFPSAVIYSFEIMEETFHILKDNVAHESRVKMHHVGFSDQSQELEMREYAGSSGHASCYDAQAGQPSRIVKCRVMKGDDFLEENGIDRVDIMKIDTEGHEFAVIKGFERAIKAGRVDVIQFEYGRVNVVSRALLYDFYQFFEKYGYVVGKIFPKFVRFKDYDFFDDNFIGPNFVAVRKRRTDIINAVI